MLEEVEGSIAQELYLGMPLSLNSFCLCLLGQGDSLTDHEGSCMGTTFRKMMSLFNTVPASKAISQQCKMNGEQCNKFILRNMCHLTIKCFSPFIQWRI